MQRRFLYYYFRIFLSLCFILSPFISTAQVPNDVDQQQNQNLEILTEQNQLENTDYTNLTETLHYYYKHPLNINAATKEELLSLQILSEIQVNNLLHHIEANGKLIEVYELQGIEGFDKETIKKLLPYIKVSAVSPAVKLSLAEMLKNGTRELSSRYQRVLEHQQGYNTKSDSAFIAHPNKYYLGSPNKIYTRYSFNYNNLFSFGIIANKDAGESFFKIDSLNKKTGFDFYTSHLCIHGLKLMKTFIIGDYQASFGQGLVMWKGFGFGKSSSVMSVKKNALGLKAYNSSGSIRFLHGIAGTFKFKKIEATTFYSMKKIDANVNSYDTINGVLTNPEVLSSITQTGSHATISNQHYKNQVEEKILGGNISYKGKSLSLGSTFQSYLLSADLVKQDQLYNHYNFSGHANYNAGIDFSYVYKNMNLFAEGAISKNSGKAFIGGLIMALDPRFNLVVLYRNFEKNYQNTMALAISENTLTQNEKGFYLGIEAHLQKNIIFTSYIDQFSFPWLKYKTAAPSNGYDFFSQLNWTPSKKTDMYFRYHNHIQQENTSITAIYDYVVLVQRQSFRYNTSFQVLPSLKLRSRLEYLIYEKQDKKAETGLLMFQDVVYEKIGRPLELTFRYALFDTDSYNTRMYSYENDIPGSFSIPALYYKGSRVYCMMKYSFNQNFEMWARLSQTFYTNIQIQNEGSLSQINGPTKTEIKLQLKYKF